MMHSNSFLWNNVQEKNNEHWFQNMQWIVMGLLCKSQWKMIDWQDNSYVYTYYIYNHDQDGNLLLWQILQTINTAIGKTTWIIMMSRVICYEWHSTLNITDWFWIIHVFLHAWIMLLGAIYFIDKACGKLAISILSIC